MSRFNARGDTERAEGQGVLRIRGRIDACLYVPQRATLASCGAFSLLGELQCAEIHFGVLLSQTEMNFGRCVVGMTPGVFNLVHWVQSL